MADITAYYNKFNEDKRLLSRHGQVEYRVTRHFIDEALSNDKEKTIADIGAGTGRYSIFYAKEGYNVTAVEPVNYNLGILKKHAREEKVDVLAMHGDARNLKKLQDESFDVTLMLGPMYHLHSIEDKVKALSEAKRITKRGGTIFVAYVMADYALIKHGFMENNIMQSIRKGALTDEYAIKSDEDELYDYVRIDDIDVINEKAGLVRSTIFTPDGPADYIRNVLNSMDEETFDIFVDYQMKNALRPEIVGAGSHTVDILHKEL